MSNNKNQINPNNQKRSDYIQAMRVFCSVLANGYHDHPFRVAAANWKHIEPWLTPDDRETVGAAWRDLYTANNNEITEINQRIRSILSSVAQRRS